MESNFVI